MAMLDVGIKIEPGSGVAAAQAFWRTEAASSREAKTGTGKAGIAA
jgi:hypothetical protein